jgi:plastocyanin
MLTRDTYRHAMRLRAASAAAFFALAAPAWGANREVSVANFEFAPATVTVAEGDTVTWTFAGPDLNHTVTSAPHQADAFDSDPGTAQPLHTPGSTFVHTFSTPGTYMYMCKVHDFMQGKVVVTGPGGAPPPDTTAPTISSAKAKKTTVAYRLDEAADVAGKLKLTKSAKGATGGKTSKAVRQAGKKGSNKLKLSTKGLRPGSYKLTLRATDAAGNRSAAAAIKLKIS